MLRKIHNPILNVDLRPYGGQWVALLGNKVISHGRDVKAVYAKAKKKFPQNTPSFMLVPGKEKWLF